MKKLQVLQFLLLVALASVRAQQTQIHPQVRTRAAADRSVSTVEVTRHFITTIRVPEAVNSVAVGDPALFEVEHSEREPQLVFVKAVTSQRAESNLLISTVKGREISVLLVSRGEEANGSTVDFLFRYQPEVGFLIEPDALPFALVAATATLDKSVAALTPVETTSSRGPTGPETLDDLLECQKRAPLPPLGGEGQQAEKSQENRLTAGISQVIDRGQQVVVLFSVVDTSRNPILLMPPQVQLAGKQKTGRWIRHEHWSTAEQLTVTDFRLSRRRIGPGERADGVVAFERPPYKQSSEMLFLQMADSGAVDRPALVPIGFGVSSKSEEANYEP